MHYHPGRLIVFVLLIMSVTVGFAEAQSEEPLPVMGINLYAPSYYDNVIYFTDATRHASAWISFPLDGNVWNDERPFPQIPDGYPAQLAQDQGVRTIVFIESEVAPAGDYTLTWAGRGTLGVVLNGGDTAEYTTTGAGEATITVPERDMTDLWLEIRATDPDDPLRDIHLWLPGFGADDDSLFTPWLKANLAPFDPIRMIDWSWINETDVSTWSERARHSWYTWGAEGGAFGRGVPYEVHIDLVNEMERDLWINIPHRANDEYVTELAMLIHERLDPELRVWVEYTNEHWNPFFPQNGWLHEQAQAIAEAENHDEYYLFHHYGRRTGEVLRIFENVFAGEPSRVIGIVGGLADWVFPVEAALNEMTRQGTRDLVDALAIAPYIQNAAEDGSWNLDALVADMDVANLTESDYTLIFEELNRAVDAIFYEDSEYLRGMQANRDLATRYDLALISYEGGQHLTAYDLNGVGFADTVEAVEGIYNQVNAHPEMYDLYMRYLDGWAEFGGETFVAFHLAGFWSDIETFGHKETILQPLDEAHKYRALLDWITRHSS